MTDEQRAEVERLFHKHGFDGELLIAPVTSEDERIFVLPPTDYAALQDADDLTTTLQAVLHRKVLVVAASEHWSGSEPLH